MEHADADATHAHLLAMLNGHWTTQAICTAAMLGLPRLLADKPCGARALAVATASNEGSLVRLLRYLMSLGLITQDDRGCYGLTRVGALLDPAGPDSLHPWAMLCRERWPRRDQLHDSVRTGEPHGPGEPGADNFSPLPHDPDAAAV